jgi:hypothetical protein
LMGRAPTSPSSVSRVDSPMSRLSMRITRKLEIFGAVVEKKDACVCVWCGGEGCEMVVEQGCQREHWCADEG